MRQRGPDQFLDSRKPVEKPITVEKELLRRFRGVTPTREIGPQRVDEIAAGLGVICPEGRKQGCGPLVNLLGLNRGAEKRGKWFRASICDGANLPVDVLRRADRIGCRVISARTFENSSHDETEPESASRTDAWDEPVTLEWSP